MNANRGMATAMVVPHIISSKLDTSLSRFSNRLFQKIKVRTVKIFHYWFLLENYFHYQSIVRNQRKSRDGCAKTGFPVDVQEDGHFRVNFQTTIVNNSSSTRIFLHKEA